jgi:large exoprotein involved in heme utilization and adhesion
MMSGANITTSASSTAPSPKVTVTADAVLLSGHTALGAPSGILSSTAPASAVVGDISLSVRNLTITDGATIQSGSSTSPQGGNVSVTAREPIVISAGGSIASQANRADVGQLRITAPALTVDNGLVKASTVDVGKAGDIIVTLDKTLSVTNGGQIQTNTTNVNPTGGAGGNVTINAGESVSLAGAASGVFSTTDNRANAGRISVTTPSLAMSDGAKMSVNTTGGGVAGDIALNLGSLTLTGGARIDSGTSGAGHGGQVAITAPASVNISDAAVSSNATASGAGGNININTPQMELTNQATLSATSTGTGNAGNISLLIGNSLRLQDSAITTAATRADGGNISITTTGSQVFLSNGRITTSVQSGFGGGGNITLGTAAHPIGFLILNGSEIRADAFGGPGGNINVFAGIFLTSNSILSASSALGVPGTIGIQAGITNISSIVGQLPESVLQAATLLRAACATRLAGGQSSSLVVSGREGLPAEPGGALPSPLVAEGPADSGLSLDEGGGHDDLSNRIALWVPAPRCLR